MATPTRFTKIGAAGQKAKVNADDLLLNRGDYYRQTIAFVLPVVAASTEQSTGILVPAGAAVNVFLNITTAEVTGTTKTIDVGLLSGAGNEFVDDGSVAATGIVLGTASALTAGDEITYTLASANFAELDAEIVIEIIGTDE